MPGSRIGEKNTGLWIHVGIQTEWKKTKLCQGGMNFTP